VDLIDPLRAPRLLWQVSLGVVAVLLLVRFVLRKRRGTSQDAGRGARQPGSDAVVPGTRGSAPRGSSSSESAA
jgi:hypothetical protein